MRFFVVVALVIAFSAPVISKQLVTASVGQVSDRILTSREVYMNLILETVLYGQRKGALKKNVDTLYPYKSQSFNREVTSVLLEWVVYLESKGFQVTQVTPAEVNKSIADFQTKLRSSTSFNSKWNTLRISRSELKQALERKLQAKKFIRFKVDSSVAPVTEKEAKDYYEANKQRFGSLPFERFRENIINFLGREQQDKRLKDWFNLLQNKYRVRNFLNE